MDDRILADVIQSNSAGPEAMNANCSSVRGHANVGLLAHASGEYYAYAYYLHKLEGMCNRPGKPTLPGAV